MHPLVANTDDLISVLDRVLDKGIVLESWARLSLQETGPAIAGNRISVASSAVYVGYGRAHKLSRNPRNFPENQAVDFLVMWRYSAVTRERRAILIYEEF
jgi:Gas vesicle protein